MLKRSFSAVVDKQTRLLVLGSLPGDRSLEERQYYAHHTNRFWALMGAVVSLDLRAMDYSARLRALLSNRIGLWDMVAEARREGSLDSNIRDHAENDLLGLLAEYPRITAVAFNGGKSAKLGLKQLARTDRHKTISLPSSSGLCAIPPDQKLAEWMRLRDYI
jgi:hypoxanthine-DNA glycosylase